MPVLIPNGWIEEDLSRFYSTVCIDEPVTLERNTMTTPLTIQQYDDAAKRIFAEAAERFMHDNAADGLVLGRAMMDAILKSAVIDQMPAIPALPPVASITQIKAREEIIEARAQIAQMNAAAEKQDQVRYQKLRLNAIAMAGTVAKSIMGITLGLAVKALAGV